MAVLVMKCPHCDAEQMTFHLDAECEVDMSDKRAILALCGKCRRPITGLFRWTSNVGEKRLLQTKGDLQNNSYLKNLGIWPKPLVIDIPQATPERVARSFFEAAQSRRAELWNAACASYRRCMELGLKDFAPDVEAWKLEKRIDKLAADNRITSDIKDWAHELRLDGNEALHGDEDATQEITDQMHHLTYFLLTYLYTLPKQIQQARDRREQSDAESN